MIDIAFKIAFSPSIGSGHLYKCARLSKALKKKNIKTTAILSKTTSGIKKNYLRKSFDNIKILRDQISEINYLKKKNIKKLLINHQNINIKKQNIYKKTLKKIILYQDLPKKNVADVIINHNLITKPFKVYKKISPKKSILLLGPKYYLFNEFSKEKNKKNKNILIFLGANTPVNMLNKILNALNKFDIKKHEIYLIKGLFNKKIDFFSKKYPNLRLKFFNQGDQNFFYNKILNCKIFISTGGSTLIESIYMLTPSIIISRAKNQINNCENFSNKKLIFYLGKKFREKELINYTKKIINNDIFYKKLIARMKKFKLFFFKSILINKIYNIIKF